MVTLRKITRMHPDQKLTGLFRLKKEKSPPDVRKSIFSRESPEALIAALQSPDIADQNDAFRFIYSAYQIPAIRFLYKKGCYDTQEAASIFQNAMIDLYDYRMKLYAGSRFMSVVMRFVITQWAKHGETLGKERKLFSRPEDMDEEAMFGTDEFLIETISLEEQKRLNDLDADATPRTLAIRAALRQLKGKHCAEIFRLELLEGLTRSEIARKLHRTVQTISTLKNNKCMEELGALLREAGVLITFKIRKQPGQSLLSLPTDPSSDPEHGA